MPARPERASDLPTASTWFLKIARDLARPFPLNEMLGEVARVTCAVLRAERATVWLHDEEAGEFHTEVVIGMDPIRIPANQGLAGACGKSRQVINVPDCYADPRFNPAVDRSSGYRTRCMLSVPLIGYDDSLIGVMQVLNRSEGSFDDDDVETATALSAHCAVALQRARLLDELLEKKRLEHELEVARQIQIGTLPNEMPEIGGYEIHGVNLPAEETGGDTFDINRLDEHRCALLLADATGHGVGPAISVTQVRSMFRICSSMGCDLEGAFEGVNRQLVEDLPTERFVTAFLGLLDSEHHRIRYMSGGQGPLLLYRASTDGVEQRMPTATPLGLFPQMPGGETETIGMEPGDILALITDGILEAGRKDGEQFGEDRVAECLRAHGHLPMAELTRILLEQVDEFTDHEPQADDITILLVKRRKTTADRG